MTLTLAAPLKPASMIVNSDLLGDIDVSEDDLLTFPAGLIGLPECQGFVLLSAEAAGLYWLQSVDHSALSFLLVDPFQHRGDYEVDLSPLEVAELGAESAGDVAVLAIVTLPRTRDESPSANLQGPLAINLATRTAKQLAIAESTFGTRTPITLPAPT